MRLFMVVFYWPWLITLGGIAPLAARLVTVVMADAADDAELEVPETAASVEALHKSVAAAEQARTYLAAAERQELDDQDEQVVVDWGRWPRADSESQLPKPYKGDERIRGTIESYSRLRVAERFASRFLSGWKNGPDYRYKQRKKRRPWPVERAEWEAQVKEHKNHGEKLRPKLKELTDRINRRVDALKRLEDGFAELTTVRQRYDNMDWIGVEEKGDPLKEELRNLLEELSDDPDVEQDVPGWQDRVNSNLLSANFQGEFQDWKSNFDSVWPKLKRDVKAKHEEWQTVSKSQLFILDRNGSGRLQAEKLDEQSKKTAEAMKVTRKKMDGVDSELQGTLKRVRTLRDSVSVEDRDSLREDAKISHGQADASLKEVEEQFEDATRLRWQATAAIKSHKKATEAWGRYQAAPRQKILERFQQVVGLLDAFPEATYPTEMIRQRLQCDMMDWLRGVFREKPVFFDATIQEARLKKRGPWMVGRFEDRTPQANYFLYKVTEIDAEGKLEAKPTPIPSFEFHGKAGDFPRQPLTNDLIKEFNALVNRAAAGFDDPRQWSEFAKGCQRLQARLDVYVALRGGRKELKINRALSFDREVTASGLLVQAAEHLKALFPR